MPTALVLPSRQPGLLSSLAELTKLRISAASTFTAAAGYVAFRRGADAGLATALLGILLLALGASAFNEVQERHLDALFALRRADDIGSGQDPDDASLVRFRARVDAQLAAEAALDRFALVINGKDLMGELALVPGPRLGHLIDALVERVLEDPGLNERATLLLLAQGMLADMDEAPDPT